MASFDEKPIHFFSTAQEWERFLQSDPSDAGVRLKLRKKSSSAPGVTWQEALDVALCHGWIDGQSKRFDDDYTLQAFTPRRKNSPWSQVNVEHTERLIVEGRMRADGLAEIERAKSDGRWDAAYRQRDAELPPELRAALDANAEAAAFIDGLRRIDRFRIIFRLTAIKTPEVRAARIRDVVEKAARGEQHYR